MFFDRPALGLSEAAPGSFTLVPTDPIVGGEVTVLGFDRDPPGEVVARCRRGRRTYRVNATALEWRGAPPDGAEWIARRLF